MSGERLISPDLNSIVIKARYKIPETDWNKTIENIKEALSPWIWTPFSVSKGAVGFYYLPLSPQESQELASIKEPQKHWEKLSGLMYKKLKTLRKGYPVEFRLVLEQRLPDGLIVKVDCIPVMYHLITKSVEREFREQSIQEAQIECARLIEEVMEGALGGQEITPPMVGPTIKRTEIKSKLLNLGLNKVVDALDVAEQHILQNKYPDALGRCRSAFEKTISWTLGKCGLEETDSIAHNLDRLKSKGFLDVDTAEMLKECYSYLARVGTPHEKGAEPGLLEAHLSLNVTLTILDYLMSRFG